MKRTIAFIPIIAVLLCSFAALAEGETGTQFSQWNADAPALKALIEYVDAVTDEASPDYMATPKKERRCVKSGRAWATT